MTENQNKVEQEAAADGVRQPEAESGHDYPMPTPHAQTAEQFYTGLIGPATLSVAASRLAVEKAKRVAQQVITADAARRRRNEAPEARCISTYTACQQMSSQ